MRILLLLLFVALLVVAAVTNPSTKDHQEKVKEQVYQSYKKKTSDPEDKQYLSYVNDAAVKAIVENLIPQYVQVDNYVLFSITRVQMDTGSERVGVGAFGNVLVDLPDNFLKGGKRAEN